MTNQELFDRVARHLLKQGQRSVSAAPLNRCSYRGAEGRMCAIGCLIPDDEYRPELEGRGVQDLGVCEAAGIHGGEQAIIAEVLQSLHDNDPPNRWRDRLADTAGFYGLSAEVLNEGK